MSSLRYRAGALLLVSLTLMGGASARTLSQAAGPSTCPIKAADTEVDFSPIAAACVPGAEGFCSSCVCSLVEVYMPAFKAAGLSIDPTSQTFPIEQATSIIEACTAEYFVPMTSAGVNVSSLEGLTTCDYSAANVPDCLVAQIAKLAVSEVAEDVAAQAGRTDIEETAGKVIDTAKAAAPAVAAAVASKVQNGGSVAQLGAAVLGAALAFFAVV